VRGHHRLGSGRRSGSDRCLEVGADDYIAKPPHLRELLARIWAVYRRAKMRSAAEAERPAAPSTAQLGKFTVNLAARAVQSASGESITLTAAEFTVLELMLTANGEAVSRDCLSEAALHRPGAPRTATLISSSPTCGTSSKTIASG
jgi:two-component system, OmpR family, response regulator